MTAIILAGGKSSRMGFDKAFLKIDGIPLIKRQIKLLKDIFGKIIIVTNNPHRYRRKGIKVVRDIIPDKGPLGGIYSGLMASTSFHNFVVACDMPFMNKALVRYMVKKKGDYDVIVPKIDGRFHPLFAVYSKKCIPAIEILLKQGKLRISNLFPKVKPLFLLKREAERFDEHLFSFTNINTKKDYYKIR